MKYYSVSFSEEIDKCLLKHLIRKDGQEDLCFATYSPSRGSKRFGGIINHIILPIEGDRAVHGNAEFFPKYFLRALKIANERKEGLAFLHAHPFPGWQDMSDFDITAEKRIAPASFGATSFPLLGLTTGNDGKWSARFWFKSKRKRVYTKKMCESVRIVGKKLSVSFNDQLAKSWIDSERQLRTISSWGLKNQENISRLKIGIVGLGSVGSIVAEILARTGISHFVLIDFDSVELKNLDRTLGVNKAHLGKAKVSAVAKSIRKSSTSTKVTIDPIEYSICEKEGFKAALDCDIIFSCVDKPWARQLLNVIAYAHLIPVIDGGIRVRTNIDNTKLLNAHWRCHITGIGHTCLECIGQYDTSMAKVESEGLLDNPTYIQGMTNTNSITASENVFLFSSHLASMEVLQFISYFISPGGISDLGQQLYQMSLGKLDVDDKICHENCYFQDIVGKGDSLNIELTKQHFIAQKERTKRQNNQ